MEEYPQLRAQLDCDGERPSLEQRMLLSFGEFLRAGRGWGGCGEPEGAALVVRRNRLWLPGDVLFVHYYNGMGERAKMTGWSSKRRAGVWKKYVAYARYKENPEDECGPMVYCDDRTVARIVTRPAEFTVETSWSDPGMRRFAVSALRAAYPAPAVSTDNGSLD